MQATQGRCVLSIVLALTVAASAAPGVSGWSNGGDSANPLAPDYGTHDWLAEHALDWLPAAEKQWILGHKAAYLFGTETPDRSGCGDCIGDTSKKSRKTLEGRCVHEKRGLVHGTYHAGAILHPLQPN